MKKNSLLLCLVSILLLLILAACSTAETSPSQSASVIPSDEIEEASQPSKQDITPDDVAIDYLGRYARYSYGIEDENINIGTVLALSEEERSALSVSYAELPPTTQTGQNYLPETITNQIPYLLDKAEFYRWWREYSGFGYTNFEVSFSEISIQIKGNYAHVSMNVGIDFVYSNQAFPSSNSTEYDVYLYLDEKTSEWLVFCVVAEDGFDSMNMFSDPPFDLESTKQEMIESVASAEKN